MSLLDKLNKWTAEQMIKAALKHYHPEQLQQQENCSNNYSSDAENVSQIDSTASQKGGYPIPKFKIIDSPDGDIIPPIDSTDSQKGGYPVPKMRIEPTVPKPPADDTLSKYYQSTGERFLPDILADILVKDIPMLYTGGRFYHYQSGVYNPITENAAKKIIRNNMKKGTIRISQIKDVLEQWKIESEIGADEINKKPNIINLRNGLLDYRTERLRKHTPKYLSTIQFDVNYDADADCPRFRKFLRDALDEEQVQLVQEIMGYFLVPETRAQKAFIIVGKPASGKSVLLRVIGEILLGKENVSHVSLQNLDDRFKTAELYGKLANIFSDLPSKGLEDNGIFKAIVGEDTITVERKNKNPFSFKCCARLLFSCNQIPMNYGDNSDGFYRRLIILRFNKSVPPENRDSNLLDKLREEADGIFQFALEGLRRLKANQFHFTETVVQHDEIQRYKRESNNVLAFVVDCCEIMADVTTSTKKTYESYKKYCEDNGYRPVANVSFNREIEENFPTVEKTSNGKIRIWRGLALRAPEDEKA